MNCTQARDQLPALLYEGHSAVESGALQAHLAACPTCRQELADLRRLRGALDAVAVPPVSVDVSRLFQEAAAAQRRRARRWRRATVALCGLAAALLLVVLLRLEVRVEARGFAVRWGESPSLEGPNAPLQPEPRVIVERQVVQPPEVEEQLRVCRETLHALARSIDSRDSRLKEYLGQLEARVDNLRLQDGRRWSETERNVAAIYKAVFVLPNRGEKQ